MNILQISSQVPVPETDGGKISIFGITKSLYRLGYNIDFVCYLKDADYSASMELMNKYCTPHLLNVKTDNSVWGALKNLFSDVPYNASKYRKKELLDYISKLLEQKKYDIIQIEHLHMGWIVDFIKLKLPKTPVILREQNLEFKIMQRFYEKEKNIFIKFFSYIQYKKFIKFEPETCAKFDCCIMISDEDKKELLSLNPKINAVAIPAGVDTSLLNYPLKQNFGKKIVHIGNLDWFPNYDGLKWFLNEVFPSILNSFPDLELYIYGGGNFDKTEIPSAIKNNVVFVGFVENLWQNLSDKALAIVPLRIGGGIRIKIIELLAYGINILTTSIGKEGIAVENGKHILIADSKDEFIKQTVDFFDNRVNNIELIKNGRKFISENYTWDAIIKKFDIIYRNLLKVR
jgi:glycosyltransferase involved in cell wall biosynthesis